MLSESLFNADLVIVGSGLFGLTIAENAARQLGKRTVILEKRNHIGGNVWSHVDSETGIEIHDYGSHIFHTNNQRVWDYVNRFTSFNEYRHQVLTTTPRGIFSLPVNLHTINQLFGTRYSPLEAEIALRNLAIGDCKAFNLESAEPRNFRERVISRAGFMIYKEFYEGYTEKQWQTNPEDIPAYVASRLPIRFDYNNFYFSDQFQGIPKNGYADFVTSMIDSNSLIEVYTSTDYFDVRSLVPDITPIVYTGPIDRFFDFKHGHLGWRTLDFETEIIDVQSYQGCAVMNFASLEVPYTRIHEFKYFHPEQEEILRSNKTAIMREFSRKSRAEDEPYYPISTSADRYILDLYRGEYELHPNVFFGGRLGSYQYLDMHMAIASALTLFDNELTQILSQKRI